MSLVKEENDQEEAEIHLKGDNWTHESNTSDRTDENMRKKNLLRESQRDKRTMSPPSLLTEDSSQFKQEEFKMFKEKETKTECEDRPSSHNCRPGLLKEDLNLFNEEASSVLGISLSKEEMKKDPENPTGQSENKPASSTLGPLKQDLNQFNEDVSGIYSITSSKDEETTTDPEDCPSNQTEKSNKEDVTSAFGITSSKDKETKKDPEEQLSQAEVKPASSTLGSLEEDLSQFKEDGTSVVCTILSKDEEVNKPVSTTLGLPKEDLSHSKEEISDISSVSSSKDKETEEGAGDGPSSQTESKCNEDDIWSVSGISSSNDEDTRTDCQNHPTGQLEDEPLKEDVTSIFSISSSTDKDAEDFPSSQGESKQDKEDVLGTCLSKDKKDAEEHPAGQPENEPASSALGSLKEDLSQFGEQATNVFVNSSKSAEIKKAPEDHSCGQAENKRNKEDVTSAFIMSSSKYKETKKDLEDRSSSQTESKCKSEDAIGVISTSSSKEMKKDVAGRPTGQTESKPGSSTLSLLKSDLTQFKEDMTSIFSISSSKDKRMKNDTEVAPWSQAVNKPASSTLGLLKDDLSQFKDGVTSSFGISLSMNKETKTDHEDLQSTQAENKPASSTLLSLLKEDVTSVFGIGSSKDRQMKKDLEDRPTVRTENKPASSTLSLLKEDLSQFKEDVTNVFGISSSKDKETKTESENRPAAQTENKAASTTLLSLLKEDVTSVFGIGSSKDRQMKKDLEDRPTVRTENKPASSTLGLLKEDLSQFKEDVSSIFSTSSSKDKETKTEPEDRPAAQTENKAASTTLLSLLKEDVTSIFSISSSKDKDTKSSEKTTNRLSFLKDDLSNVFKIGLSKERDAARDDSSNTFKITDSRAERTDEPFKSLFRRDQRTLQKAANNQRVRKTFSETTEEQTDDGLTGKLSEKKEETVNAEKMNNNLKEPVNEVVDGELDLTVSEEESAQTAEQMCESEDQCDDSTVVTAENSINKEEEEEEEEKEEKEEKEEEEEEEGKPSETLPWEPLSSGIHLFSPRDPNKDNTRDQPGDEVWSVKNFACYLTFDPNTANSELCLSDCNRMATRVWSDHQPSEHPDRFKRCPQVLCREGLLDSVYWEVVWIGGADIGVTYNNICRDGDTASCLLGHNERSWSLECSEGSYTPCHQNKRFRSSSPQPFTHRVGVHLDWSAGSLSFYCVSQDAMVHLHTFTSTFTEPLYPAFWVWAYDGSVSLCQVELDWERLLQ